MTFIMSLTRVERLIGKNDFRNQYKVKSIFDYFVYIIHRWSNMHTQFLPESNTSHQ